jgi:hypothetical protein
MLPKAEALRGPIPAFASRAGGLLDGSPAVPRTLWANLVVVGLPYLAGGLGPGVVMDGRGPGVICTLRTGESGRGIDARGFFAVGLGARPGPTDRESFGSDGVGGVKLVEFWLATFSPPGPVGVRGNELVDCGAQSRLAALDRGTKIPVPAVVVVK